MIYEIFGYVGSKRESRRHTIMKNSPAAVTQYYSVSRNHAVLGDSP